MNQVKYCDLIDCENNEDARSGHRMVVINDILYVIGNYDLNPILTLLGPDNTRFSSKIKQV